MKVTEVRAAYPKWRQVRPADAWQAHFWQIAVRVVTDVGVAPACHPTVCRRKRRKMWRRRAGHH